MSNNLDKSIKNNSVDGSQEQNQASAHNVNTADATFANAAALQQQMLLMQMQKNQLKTDEINLDELWHAIWAGKKNYHSYQYCFCDSLYFLRSFSTKYL